MWSTTVRSLKDEKNLKIPSRNLQTMESLQ
uniref:Uncharacterized protein n=1 Tax=Arundo donax TaxID=35708 RepID=A0A0A9B7V6_ARUDO